jgi:hypothetical protein
MDLRSARCPRGFWPVYKGESFDIWEPDSGTYYAWANPRIVREALQQTRIRSAKNKRSAFWEFRPEVIQSTDSLPCLRPRVVFRDISRATDTRTVRAALVPARVFLTNKAPYFVWPRGEPTDEAYLLGVLCSIPLDWYARRFVEISVNFYILNPFPIPRPPAGSPLRRRVVALAGRLAAPDDRFREWAAEVGVSCGPLGLGEREDMIHELDAAVAHLYGLSEAQLTHVFETFHEGWDYHARLQATLDHYRRLARLA